MRSQATVTWLSHGTELTTNTIIRGNVELYGIRKSPPGDCCAYLVLSDSVGHWFRIIIAVIPLKLASCMTVVCKQKEVQVWGSVILKTVAFIHFTHHFILVNPVNVHLHVSQPVLHCTPARSSIQQTMHISFHLEQNISPDDDGVRIPKLKFAINMHQVMQSDDSQQDPVADFSETKVSTLRYIHTQGLISYT